jgi:dTDP-4-amino-4,6-dideoxygalactose transaminase
LTPPRIPFTRIHLTGRELDYLREVVDSSQLAGDGAFSRRCEEWLERTIGCSRALLTHSGTAALEMAAILADVGPGDEVIMPSFTFPSTANAFVLRGAVPVFVDIQPDTLNLDPEALLPALTSRTRAIVPVHYAGVACDMEAILSFARNANLVVIEDAAQSLLSSHQGRPLGSLGTTAALSFHQTKNIAAGEAGALIVNDPSLIERAEVIREKGTNRSRFYRGQVDKYTWVDIGSSYLPGELIAAFLFAQLQEAEQITAIRKAVWERYHDALEPLESAGRLVRPVPAVGNAHIYYVLLRSLTERTEVIEALRRQGISAVFHYVPLHTSPAGLRYGRAVGTLPVTNDVSERLLRLPLWSDMTAAEVDLVVDTVAAAMGAETLVGSPQRAAKSDVAASDPEPAR